MKGNDCVCSNQYITTILQGNVYIHDPDFAYAPIAVEHDAFLAAWQERENRYAVLQLTDDA
jgi:hypothetical protein